MVATIDSVNEDNQFTGPRPTPTIPDGGSYSVYNKVVIKGTPAQITHALMNISNWKEWNRFVPTVTIDKPAAGQTDMDSWVEGQIITFNCLMDDSDSITKNKELAVQVGPVVTKTKGSTAPARTVVRWVSQGWPNFVVKAEHVNWIDDNGDGTCTYQHWETFGGMAVPAIKMMHGKSLHDNFIAWAEDLKAYVEKQ